MRNGPYVRVARVRSEFSYGAAGFVLIRSIIIDGEGVVIVEHALHGVPDEEDSVCETHEQIVHGTRDLCES